MSSSKRVDELYQKLSGLTVEDAVRVEEQDRQFKALQRLYEKIKNPELFLKLTVINALLSYQLQMKGEDYWERFAEFFSQKPEVDAFPEFLEKFNRRFLNAKLKRFEKVKKCVESFFRKHTVEEIGKNLKLLVEELSECLKQRKDAKTVVFAAKMFMYGYRIVFGKDPEGLEEIEIPLDSRLKKLLPTVKEWRELSDRLGIPPIHLDALVWVPKKQVIWDRFRDKK